MKASIPVRFADWNSLGLFRASVFFDVVSDALLLVLAKKGVTLSDLFSNGTILKPLSFRVEHPLEFKKSTAEITVDFTEISICGSTLNADFVVYSDGLLVRKGSQSWERVTVGEHEPVVFSAEISSVVSTL